MLAQQTGLSIQVSFLGILILVVQTAQFQPECPCSTHGAQPQSSADEAIQHHHLHRLQCSQQGLPSIVCARFD